MKWKPIILIALGVNVVVLLFFQFYPHTQQDVVRQVFKNREKFSVIQNPQLVTAELLHSKNGASPILDGYTKDAPVGLSPQEIQSIQNLLEKPASYHWGIGNGCMPDYGVLLNFRSQGHIVRVALCFKCDMFGVFDGDNDSAEQINREYIMDLMRPQLVAIAKEIFPNDKEIQGLK